MRHEEESDVWHVVGGGGLVSFVFIFWIAVVYGQPTLKIPLKTKVPAIAADKLEAAIRAVDCSSAYSEYQGIDRAYQDKLGICNQMDREQRKRDDENAIQSRLMTMRFDSEIFAGRDDWQRRCSAFIERYERESQAAEDMASTNYWSYWERCHFEGDSLTSLESARREAEEVVCEKCGNRWPGPDTMYWHCRSESDAIPPR